MKVIITNHSSKDLAVIVASVASFVAELVERLPFGIIPRGQGDHHHLATQGIIITLLPITPERPANVLEFDVIDAPPKTGRNLEQCTTS